MATGIALGQDPAGLPQHDWAGLRVYAQADKEISEAPEVVFMGNSITEGWRHQHPDFFTRNNFAGRGISGQTSSEMLVRFRQDVIDLHPKAVAILAGTNDLAMNNGYIAMENIVRNIVSMCELARFNGIKVLLCSVPPATRFGWRPQIETTELIPQLNALLKAYADTAEGVEWVDYFSALAAPDNTLPETYSPEGCHPNGEGYKVMERIIVPAINRINGTNKEYFIY